MSLKAVTTKLIFGFIGALSLSATTVARADWSSGGGFVFKDAQNPWWVQNTSQVDYCIQRDAAHFSVPEEKIEQIVARAFAYWKAEFARSSQGHAGSPVVILVATQQFNLVPCGPNVPLVFQFGTLTAEQTATIAHPEQLVGLASRTAYDVPTLRGRGFVYLAPDSGPYKPVVPNALGATVPDGFWSYYDGTKLLRAVAHELGHVFGVPHRGSEQMLMGEGHPEWLLGFDPWVDNGSIHIDNYVLPAMFNFDYRTDYLYCNRFLASLYGTPAGMNCMHLRGNASESEPSGLAWTVSADQTAPEQPFATLAFERFYGDPRTSEDLVKLYVPVGHPLFGGHCGYLRVVEWKTPFQIGGTFKFADATKPSEPALIRLWPGSFEIMGLKFDQIDDLIDGGYFERRILFMNN